MPKQGEIEYLKNIGPTFLDSARKKPFSDELCALNLMEIGAVMHLLPQPPARLLDLGCGTGWTSVFWAKRGYRVVGQDIAPDMIYYAEQNRDAEHLDNLQFVVSDYESLSFQDEFDCAVFYDCLHHAEDEVAALRAVYKALRPGGICIACEPGEGHSKAPESIKAMQEFGVTERDMPPWLVKRAAKQVGFRFAHTLPHAASFSRVSYLSTSKAPLDQSERSPLRQPWLDTLRLVFLNLIGKHRNGIVVLEK
jgi:ubiquinone/menaquinone biosynthesis C-methylase UbiE